MESESLLCGKTGDMGRDATLASRSNSCAREASDDEGGDRGPSLDGVATGVELSTGTELSSTSEMLLKLSDDAHVDGVRVEHGGSSDRALGGSMNVLTGGSGHELFSGERLGSGGIVLAMGAESGVSTSAGMDSEEDGGVTASQCILPASLEHEEVVSVTSQL